MDARRKLRGLVRRGVRPTSTGAAVDQLHAHSFLVSLHEPHARSAPPAAMADKLALMRRNWDKFAARFTETANKRMSLQCARQLHAHMQLEGAAHVLEVAAGGGLGSLDIARRMGVTGGGDSARKALTVTDFSPAMLEIARENLKDVATSALLDLRVMEANGARRCIITCMLIARSSHRVWPFSTRPGGRRHRVGGPVRVEPDAAARAGRGRHAA